MCRDLVVTLILYIIELRKATLPIFFDMMQCEFYQTIQSPQGSVMNSNFRQVGFNIIAIGYVLY